MKKYAVATTVQTFRHRYMVAVDDLQALNPEHPVEPEAWLSDMVTLLKVEEASQKWLGEQIVDTCIMDEDQALALFDEDNPYLSGWSREKKIEHLKKFEIED